jgi:hypothetical protein
MWLRTEQLENSLEMSLLDSNYMTVSRFKELIFYEKISSNLYESNKKILF